MLFILYYFDGSLFNITVGEKLTTVRVTRPETFFSSIKWEDCIINCFANCVCEVQSCTDFLRGSGDNEERIVLKVLPLNFNYNSYTLPVLCVGFYKVFSYKQRGSGL